MAQGRAESPAGAWGGQLCPHLSGSPPALPGGADKGLCDRWPQEWREQGGNSGPLALSWLPGGNSLVSQESPISYRM